MKNIAWMVVVLFVQTSFGWTHLSTNIKGWNTKKLTFYVNPTNCTLPEATLYDILDTSINAWNGIPNSGLELSRSSTPVTTTVAEFNAGTATQVPLILCDPNMAEADYIPGMTTNTALNTAGFIIYSGILLNANTSGAAEISNLTKAELEVTIAHEIGHALGLGHSSDIDALMYYSIGNKPRAILTQDDMDGITHIYPRNELSGGAFGCSSVHGKSTRQTFLWFWIGLLAVCSNVWVWRFRSERPL